MNRSCWVIAVMIVFLSAGTSPAAEPVSVLLERGIYAEEAKGDIDGAMAIYRQVLDETASNAAFGAEASYRLGCCYIKKGDTTNALEALRFATAHATDTNLAAAARERIVDVNWRPLALEKEPWANGEVTHSIMYSRDGQVQGVVEQLSKADRYEGRDVWVLDWRSLQGSAASYPAGHR